MDREYRKVVISIIVIVIIIVGIGIFWKYKQESKFSPLERDLISFLEKHPLSEGDQAKLNNAINILREKPKDVSALITIAEIRQKVKDVDGSIEFYLKALEVQPTNVVALNNLADLYDHQKKEYEKSAEMYLRSIENTPEQISAYQSLMYIYQHRLPEKYPDMEQILLTAIEKNTDISEYAPVDFYSMLGDFYANVDEINKAIKYYEIALGLMPGDESVKIKIERLKELK
ncbi:tetratricopeptide repeat protein [Patescibacteria group bacterium]|nr:tetratricopeptide repeat protein [Patescibacteria group bacterium]